MFWFKKKPVAPVPAPVQMKEWEIPFEHIAQLLQLYDAWQNKSKNGQSSNLERYQFWVAARDAMPELVNYTVTVRQAPNLAGIKFCQYE